MPVIFCCSRIRSWSIIIDLHCSKNRSRIINSCRSWIEVEVELIVVARSWIEVEVKLIIAARSWIEVEVKLKLS